MNILKLPFSTEVKFCNIQEEITQMVVCHTVSSTVYNLLTSKNLLINISYTIPNCWDFLGEESNIAEAFLCIQKQIHSQSIISTNFLFIQN